MALQGLGLSKTGMSPARRGSPGSSIALKAGRPVTRGGRRVCSFYQEDAVVSRHTRVTPAVHSSSTGADGICQYRSMRLNDPVLNRDIAAVRLADQALIVQRDFSKRCGDLQAGKVALIKEVDAQA